MNNHAVNDSPESAGSAGYPEDPRIGPESEIEVDHKRQTGYLYPTHEIMKNSASIRIIVGISLFTALMHFLIGPGYQGILRDFLRGYLIDILLPMNLYLLLQIALRQRISVRLCRWIAAAGTFLFGVTVELFQWMDIDFFGSTFDPLDILMYGIGTGLGIAFDLVVIERVERAGDSAGKT